MSRPLFSLGSIVATPGALEAMEHAGTSPAVLLARHQRGDWGDLSADDRRENEFSLGRRLRIFSAYHLDPDVKIWVITEADRSATTLLLPCEY
jgi:hypothetical protein